MPDIVDSDRRHLAWQKCYNTRDLGGLPTSDGHTTRWQSVIRSDYLNRLSDGGRRAMIDYGVRTIIDLRGPDEVAKEPSPFAHCNGQTAGLRYLNMLLRRYDVPIPEEPAPPAPALTRADHYCRLLDGNPEMVASVLLAISRAAPGGVVVHCHAGKDRTGIVAALLLSLAGVPDPIIAEDYAETQRWLWPRWEERVAAAGGEDLVDPTLKPVTTVETMLATLAHLEHRYGGVRPYLIAGGLTAEDMERLRERLRS